MATVKDENNDEALWYLSGEPWMLRDSENLVEVVPRPFTWTVVFLVAWGVVCSYVIVELERRGLIPNQFKWAAIACLWCALPIVPAVRWIFFLKGPLFVFNRQLSTVTLPRFGREWSRDACDGLELLHMRPRGDSGRWQLSLITREGESRRYPFLGATMWRPIDELGRALAAATAIPLVERDQER